MVASKCSRMDPTGSDNDTPKARQMGENNDDNINDHDNHVF